MFDPAAASARMQPGDKISFNFSKAKAEPGQSFMQNAQNAGLVPGGQNAAAQAPPSQMSAASQPAVPDHRAMMLAMLRRRMGR